MPTPLLPPRRVLIITGAGASARLGDEDTPIPTMSGWATSLVDELGERAEQIGLSANMPGELFEENLGRFLAFEQALSVVASFGHLGSPASMGVPGDFTNWFNQATSNVGIIRQGLWRNLFDNFGTDRINDAAAARAYKRLHRQIRSADGDGPESYLAYATTNYDSVIEVAIAADEALNLQDGFTRRAGAGRELYAPNLFTESIGNSTSNVPVLHIHGAVGWYTREDGSITRRPTDERFDDRQTPALLLPDSTKQPDAFAVPAFETWQQFKRLLGLSTHVLFLGHSLHDKHIVAAVNDSATEVGAVAYTPVDGNGALPPVSEDSANELRALIPRVSVFAGDFGQPTDQFDIDNGALQGWLKSGPRLTDTAP